MSEYNKNIDPEDIVYLNESGVVSYEVWKDIPDYEGLYQVSDLGRIKSLDRYFINAIGVISNHKGQMIKLQTDKKGYSILTLNKLGKSNTKKVSRLVMLAFVGKSDLFVDHINEIKNDNRLANLRYCTNRQNITYSVLSKGKKHCNSVGVVKCRNKFQAIIRINKITYNLGSYPTEKEASEKYQVALDKWVNYQEIPNYINTNYYSLHKYVTYHKVSKKWMVSHKGKHIGYFLTESDAKEALDKYLETL